jgi:hypothetical protein
MGRTVCAASLDGGHGPPSRAVSTLIPKLLLGNANSWLKLCLGTFFEKSQEPFPKESLPPPKRSSQPA